MTLMTGLRASAVRSGPGSSSAVWRLWLRRLSTAHQPLDEHPVREGEHVPPPRVIYEPKPGSPLVVDRDFYARLAEDRAHTLVERFVVLRRRASVASPRGPRSFVSSPWKARRSRTSTCGASPIRANASGPRVPGSSTRRTSRPSTASGRACRTCGPCSPSPPTRSSTGATRRRWLPRPPGTQCDPYVHKLLNGEEFDLCCHSNPCGRCGPTTSRSETSTTC